MKCYLSVFRIGLVSVVLGLLLPTQSWAENQDMPEQIDGVPRVSAEDLLDKVDEHPDLVIIDARIRGDRLQGYIEGSLSLPDIKTNCDSLAEKVPSLNTPVLFYCNGVKCGRSVNAVRIAQRCGYQTIYWFRGGFTEWQSKGYPYLSE